MTVGTHWMLGILDVKGEATEASASDSDIPAWAVFSACRKYTIITSLIAYKTFEWHINYPAQNILLFS